MSKVLYIRGSPRGERSHSVTVADAFAEAYKTFHPNDTVSTLDLFRTDLPPFDGLALQAKYTILHGKQHTPEELQAWKAVEAAIAEPLPLAPSPHVERGMGVRPPTSTSSPSPCGTSASHTASSTISM